jgi:hypothetical protein
MNEAEQYYVDLGGQTAGPFTVAELARLYCGGTVTRDTLFTKPGAVTWLRVETILPLLAAGKVPPIQASPVALAPAAPAVPQLRRGEVICPQCRRTVVPRKQAPGSFAVEVALWLLFCAPGLVYSIWRISAPRRRSCPGCGATL